MKKMILFTCLLSLLAVGSVNAADPMSAMANAAKETMSAVADVAKEMTAASTDEVTETADSAADGASETADAAGAAKEAMKNEGDEPDCE